ncbi:hypothetical protein METHB2_80025 [Candidatus Methylobacter favarea]|uniref:Uncharacterized protein n=1 Tax=Candidatus Methylobacter favarea TaxID=2707345 RepID=A0A8S0XVF9_9GAMM|nr:hypothetical protein [Candidatus Methylobacter favarea]CAA9892708.1 hypothetical protein METHB2_80025 [Candidatus Methylobacter favarea]
MFASAKLEAGFIVNSLKKLIEQDLAKACISVRRHTDMERYLAALGESGIAFYQIDQNTLDNTAQPGVRLATMH